MTLTPPHSKVKEQLMEDLKASVEHVKANPQLGSKGSAAMYGLVAKIPAENLVEKFLKIMLGKIYSADQ